MSTPSTHVDLSHMDRNLALEAVRVTEAAATAGLLARIRRGLRGRTSRELAATHDALVTVEEGSVMGGAGAAVMEALHAEGFELPVLQLGLPDVFTEHGDPGRLLASMGLDEAGIERAIRTRFATLLSPAVKAVG